jgi:hypothetical protein
MGVRPVLTQAGFDAARRWWWAVCPCWLTWFAFLVELENPPFGLIDHKEGLGIAFRKEKGFG